MLNRTDQQAIRRGKPARGEDLRARALDHVAREGGLRHGHDYVLAAELR